MVICLLAALFGAWGVQCFVFYFVFLGILHKLLHILYVYLVYSHEMHLRMKVVASAQAQEWIRACLTYFKAFVADCCQKGGGEVKYS